jgi:site-specific recombinase XerD
MTAASTKRPPRGRTENPARTPDEPKGWQSALTRLEGAYAINTIRAYESDFKIFEAWCRREQHAALPATAATVAAFVQAQSESATPATVSRRRAAIAKIHKLMKLESPVRDEEVNLATRKVFRQKGRRQKQALGLTAPLKAKILAACPDDLRGLRDRALIAMGYDTLCRRSELVALRMEDFAPEPDGSGTILVRKAKADQYGRGRLAYLSAETVTALARWREAGDFTTGPIFRHVIENLFEVFVRENSIQPNAVSDILKRRAKEAGLDAITVKRLSGHSLRVGAAQDMAAAGIELVAIMHAGGWRSPEMVMRYVEHMDVRKSGMARLYQVG